MTVALGRLLGSGRVAEVFEYGDGVLKLYRAADAKPVALREADALAHVEALGLPAPRPLGVVEHDGRWGVAMTRAAGEPFAVSMQQDGASVGRYVDATARMHAAILAQPGRGLPRLRDRLGQNLRRAPIEDALRSRLLARLGELPAGDRLCHGDFHPFNIVGTLDRPLVVDWPDACAGPPAADIARTHVLLRAPVPEFAEALVGATLDVTGLSLDEVRAWLPIVAAARLAEGEFDDAPLLHEMAAGQPGSA